MPNEGAASTPVKTTRSPKWAVPLLCFGIMALAVGVYARAAGNGFVMFDDDINIYNNPMLGSPTWARIQWAFTDDFYMPRYMPLGWISLMAIFAFGGLDPLAYHGVNILLHTANAGLLFLVAVKGLGLLDQACGRPVSERWRLGVAALAAIFWAVHPLRVEPVSWATGVHYLHATFWALLATWLLWARLDRHGRSRRLYFAAAWVAYLFSVLVYPVTLGLSVALFLFELWWSRRRASTKGEKSRSTVWRLGRAHAPFFALSACGVGANIWIRMQVTSFFSQAPGLESFSLLQRILQACHSAVYYALRPLVPPNPTPLYPTQLVDGRLGAGAWVCLGMVAVLLVVLAKTWRNKPGFATWCVGFAFVGVSYYGLLESPFQTSDRYTYFTSVMLALGGAMLAHRVPAGRWRGVAAVTAIAWCGWLAMKVPAQMPVWRDNTHLFTHISRHLEGDPDQALYYKGRLAVSRAREGERAGMFATLVELQRAGISKQAYSQIIDEISRIEAASARIRPRLAPPRGWIAPDAQAAYLNAVAVRNADDAWTTRVRFARAVAIDPGFADARYDFAMWLAVQGEPAEAWDHYQRLKQAGPAGFDGVPESALRRVIAESARYTENKTLSRAVLEAPP